jgi:hypothetical protein
LAVLCVGERGRHDVEGGALGAEEKLSQV